MGSYIWKTFDGNTFNGDSIDLQQGASTPTANVIGTPGTPYCNTFGGSGVLQLKDAVETALTAATGDTWVLDWVQANEFRWSLQLKHNGAADWEILGTGTFALSLLGINVSNTPITVPAGGAYLSEWHPAHIWYWNQGRNYRRRPVYKVAMTVLETSGAVTAKRANEHYLWNITFSAVRGAHIFKSDLSINPTSISSSSDDPNVSFEAMWEYMHQEVNFTPQESQPATYYTFQCDDKDFVGDIHKGLKDRTEEPLAILDLTFSAREQAP